MDPASIQAMIENGLPGAQVDVSGADGVHFEATVVPASLPASCRWRGIGWSTPRWAT
jgi:acid stress-induced BolA-like protein IbaG/YrbA